MPVKKDASPGATLRASAQLGAFRIVLARTEGGQRVKHREAKRFCATNEPSEAFSLVWRSLEGTRKPARLAVRTGAPSPRGNTGAGQRIAV